MSESPGSTTFGDSPGNGRAARPNRSAPNSNAPETPDLPGAPGVSYETARAELEEVVRQLEAGGVTLEQSLALWERGEELARTCQALLDGARARLAAADPTRDA
ncbi:exodeoxyribonuclease VII small subunit [Frankia gtarii]|uniref:exodeoxyribonuclease VII small subunit n=1 Tax=Frankia gtarii TaxID=2950102 RepID=UPI0021C18C5C|nr:exodeoxyribonuclease VII small subunit [Frankia gtarii]